MLTKTPLHDQIAERLAKRWPNWSQIADRYSKSKAYEHLLHCARKNEIPLGSFAGHIAEMHLRVALEEICKELGAQDRVVFDPIKSGSRGKYFKFYTDKEERLFAVAPNGTDYSEMDEPMLIEDIPTLFEIRIKNSHGGRKHKMMSHSRLMSEDHVNYLLAPLRDYFNTPQGAFVFIIPPASVKENETAQAFKERGGLLVPFYKNRHDYHCDVDRLLRDLKNKSEYQPFKDLLPKVQEAV